MKILVKARPGARREYVEEITEPSGLFSKGGMRRFVVSVKEPPVDGRANEAIEKALANHFKVSRANVRIVSGKNSRQKIVEVDISVFM